MAYSGYSGYDQASVKQQRALADALFQRSLQGRGQPIQSWTQGAAKLVDAFMAREAGQQASKAEADYAAGQKTLADAMISQMYPDAQGLAKQDLNAPAAFDLRPAAMEQRQQEGGMGGRVRSLAQLTGDPMAAIEMHESMRNNELKREDLQLQRDINKAKLNAPIEVSSAATLWDPVSGQALFTAPGRPDGANYQAKVGGNGNWWNYNTSTGEWTDTGNPAPARSSNGIDLQFNDDGSISGLSIGGTGPKGKEPSVVNTPRGPAVSPGQQQLVANKSWQAMQSAGSKTSLVREEIARALPLVSGSTTGVWASTKNLPFVGNSTDSGRLANMLKTIKANVGFDELQSMRENSPTGGALGQVAVQELEMLQAILGSLEQSQTSDDLTFNLKRLDNYMANRDERRRAAFAMDYPSLAQFAGFAGSVGKPTGPGAAAPPPNNALQALPDDELERRIRELEGR